MCLVLISVAGIVTLASELRSGSFDPNRGSIAIWIARIHDLKRYFVRPNNKSNFQHHTGNGEKKH